MAIKHSVKTGTGRTKNVNLTPRRAIRLKCFDCSGWQWNEVKLCPITYCPLWPYRNDGPPKGRVDDKAGGENEK